MKIGILQCGHLEKDIAKKHGNFGDMFSALLAGNGFAFEYYVVVDSHFPDAIDECDGWLVTGSAHGAYDELVWIGRLEEFIRQSYEHSIPSPAFVLVIRSWPRLWVAGVEKFSGGWGIGHTRYSLTQDDSYVDLLALHQDQVVETPPQARVIACTEFLCQCRIGLSGQRIEFSAPSRVHA